jgi:hypothetical protein
MEFRKKSDYYQETKYFKPTQPNPSEKGLKSTKGDCVIRAFAIAGDIRWLDAFDMLVDHARKHYNVPNDKANYEKVYENFGFVKHPVKVVKGQSRMTVEDFCKEHPVGKYILVVANHNTAVVDGVCRDTWNPANKCVYKYFELT